ncbi:MAG: acetyl xylan esterase [Clostridiaceae bacterium]|nr:acetyl xylan esterase [Clostridiaceae bacterium]
MRRKLLVPLLLLSLIITVLCISVYAEPVRYGDLNGDEKVNSTDYVLLGRYILGKIDVFPASDDTSIADLDRNSKINSTDYTILKRYILGIITEIPIGSIPASPTPTIPNTGTPGIGYTGRFDFSDSKGPRFAWTASTITANFEGTEVKATIKSQGDNWFNVIIDGVVKTPININNTTKTITLASGLSNGKHNVTLFKRTEAQVGVTQFLGFDFGSGKLLAPPPEAERKIEFIGDSITCAYGNEGTDKSQPFTPPNENSYMSYASITCRALNADQICVSYSGKGVVSNYGGNTNELMPFLYPRIMPQESTTWDYSKWTPDVVVINLGTNDFSVSAPGESSFVNAYKDLVKKVRSQYPDAHIFCTMGPMLWGDSITICRGYLNKVVDSYNSAGDKKVYFLEYPQQQESDGYGEDWHPSIKTHQKMADLLTSAIKEKLGW